MKMTSTHVHILFCTDKNYLHQTIVAMHSVLINTNSFVTFHILYSDLSDEDTFSFDNIRNMEKCDVKFRKIECSDFIKYLPEESGHYTTPVYYRFIFSDIFQDADKILYLDSDVIVNADISVLFSTDMKNHPVAMCEDFNKYEYNTRLGMHRDSIYYNAGVMLINCKIWRHERLLAQLLQRAADQREAILFPIQDILNPLLENKIFTLDKSWNFQVYQNCNGRINTSSCAITIPKIFHYIGSIKPWSKSRSDCFFYKYFQIYLEISDIQPERCQKDTRTLRASIFLLNTRYVLFSFIAKLKLVIKKFWVTR